jgi:hypothetical protein
MTETIAPKPAPSKDKSHIPSNSVFFEKIVPILFIGLGILMAFLILFALAVLVGVIRF